ncbi:unnamed protein product [Ambrosiozyma monospora]|uniref:Unnamed protein product n=1 Tax=Ambrosiozyma monospora TaxID=43982 RepID=A0ACB5U8F9_AMBMO|nr:unnamed protein product [Ambrosiozyma monospora]
MVILFGGFELLIDKKREHPELNHDDIIVVDYLRFAFRYINSFMEIVISNWKENPNNIENLAMLLPCVRLLLCWMKERELPKGYLLQCEEYIVTLAELLNVVFGFFQSRSDAIELVEDETFKLSLIDNGELFDSRPVRSRLFKEDITLKDFQPVNYYMSDFDDDDLYKQNEASILALIGELPGGSHSNLKMSDNILRLVAVGNLGRAIISNNELGVVFNTETGVFEFPESLDETIKSLTSRLATRTSALKKPEHAKEKRTSTAGSIAG